MNPTTTSPAAAEALATTLLANLGAFQAFARKRLGDEQIAADAVQESLLRALRAAPRIANDRNLLAWFYRILRNVLADLHRERGRERTKLSAFTEDPTMTPDAEVESVACACLKNLLSTLRPEYSVVIQRMDLDGTPPEETAKDLGITRNLLKVRLHRARRQLRDRLIQTCQACANHGCLDCTCGE